MMRRIAALAMVGALALAIAGCSAAPDRAEVVERFTIELEGDFGESADGAFDEVADGLADDALAGMCGSDAYLSQIDGQPALVRAWAATCTMMFEHDLTDAQAERFRQVVVDEALEGISE